MLSGKGAAILCCFGCDCESIVFLGFVNTVFLSIWTSGGRYDVLRYLNQLNVHEAFTYR